MSLHQETLQIDLGFSIEVEAEIEFYAKEGGDPIITQIWVRKVNGERAENPSFGIPLLINLEIWRTPAYLDKLFERVRRDAP